MGDQESLLRIKNLEAFKEDIRDKVRVQVRSKLSKYLKDEESSILEKIDIDGQGIPEDILEYEVDKFVLVDEFDPNRGYINKHDVSLLITSLKNEIICRHLNELVDNDIMEMCWNKDKCEFIWRPKIKE